MATGERKAWMVLLAVRDKIQTAEQYRPCPLYSYFVTSHVKYVTAFTNVFP
jgi:hypothetical protein